MNAAARGEILECAVAQAHGEQRFIAPRRIERGHIGDATCLVDAIDRDDREVSGDAASPARSEFVMRLATRYETPATGPIWRILRGRCPMRLLLRAPAPITPKSARALPGDSDARDIFYSKQFDSIAYLRGSFKFG